MNGWGKVLPVLIPGLIVALLAVAGFAAREVSGIRKEMQEMYMPRTEIVVRIDALQTSVDRSETMIMAELRDIKEEIKK